MGITQQGSPFREKVDDCCELMFREHFPELSYPDAAEKCAEIAAVCAVYGGLLGGGLSESDAEYLMQFENPLKVLAEKWREDSLSPKLDIEIDYAVELLKNEQAERYNPLDLEYYAPAQGQQMG